MKSLTVFAVAVLGLAFGCSGGGAASPDGGVDQRAGTEAGTDVGAAAETGGHPLLTLHFSWTVAGVGDGADKITCANINAEAVSIALFATDEHATLVGGGQVACATGSLDIGDLSLPRGDYTFAAQFGVGSGATRGKMTGRFTYTDQPNITIAPFQFVFERLSYSWSLRRGGATVTCEEAAAARFELTFVAGIAMLSFGVDCGAYAFSHVLSPATYVVSARLLDARGGALATWTAPAPLVITTTTGGTIPAVVFNLD